MDARELYSKNGQLLDSMIAAGDFDTAELALQKAIAANNVLYADAKRKGLDNLRYWVKGGRDLEEEASINSINLQSKVNKLNLAKLQSTALVR
jgi:hypothetical protein